MSTGTQRNKQTVDVVYTRTQKTMGLRTEHDEMHPIGFTMT